MNESTNILVDIMSEQTATASAKEKIEFEEAFTLHHRTVFRAARSVVQDAALAEDITQAPLLQVSGLDHRFRNAPSVAHTRCDKCCKEYCSR